MSKGVFFVAVFLCMLSLALGEARGQWVPDGVAVCTATLDQTHVTITSDGAGGAILAWRDNRNGNLDVYAQRIDAAGSAIWTAGGVPVCTNTSDQWLTDIKADGLGGAILVWEDARGGMADLYAQRLDSNGNSLWTAGGIVICAQSQNQVRGRILSDGAGGAIIVWQDSRIVAYEIYAQRIDAAGVLQWSAGGVNICSLPSSQPNPEIAPDGSGGAIIAWQDSRTGTTNYNIYAQRIGSGGTVAWATNGVGVCTVTGNQQNPRILSDGAGGAIIAWQDERAGTGNFNIYADRIDGTGASLWWPGDGRPICTAASAQTLPLVVSDGSGGAIIAWQDARNGNNDVFAQRISASAAIQWAANGVGVCTNPQDQVLRAIVSDGASGAILAWADYRDGEYDIYAQIVDGTGTPRWIANGAVVCAASGTQETPVLIDSAAGTAIIAWKDSRSGTSADIYAQSTAEPYCLVSPGAIDFGTVEVHSFKDSTFTIKNIGPDTLAGSIPEYYLHFSVVSGGGAYSIESGDSLVVTVRFGPKAWGPQLRGISTGTYCSYVTCTGMGSMPPTEIAAWGYNNYGQCNVPDPNENLVAVSGGEWHSLGVRSDGTIAAFGRNNDGQCNVPAPNADFVVVSAGRSHSLGLKSDGSIVGWGLNLSGQCNVPAPNTDFIAVAAGYTHSMGLKSDGTIVAWGTNNNGETSVPAPNADFVDIAVGWYHSMGLKSDGTIVTWGWNNNGQCTVPAPNEDFIAIASGMAHSLGLKSDGAIVAFGRNSEGQCNVPAPNADFIGMGGGFMHSLGLKADGVVVAWGTNSANQCNVPVPNSDYLSVDAGDYHSLGVRKAPICAVSPTGINLGDVFIDAYKDTSFVIKNIGYGAMAGNVSEPCSQWSIVSGGSYTIAPGDSQIVTVRFSPTIIGVDVCTFDPGTGCDGVPIQGWGLGPEGSRSPDSLDFGYVTIGRSEDLEFVITNVGGGRLLGSVSESNQHYSIVSGGGAFDLGHGDTLRVTVRFEPLVTGLITCTVTTGCGSCGDMLCRGIGDRMPRIFAIRDVPGDQGGFLNVSWDAAPGDNPTDHAITRYTVWRAIEPTAAELANLEPGSIITRISDIPPEVKTGIVRLAELEAAKFYWKLISSLDAYYIDAYSEVVPTLFDSTAECTEYHYVQIIAHSADPYVFWISPPDSGRSIDNLSPATPLYLAGEQSYAPEGLRLTWAPNGEADLGHYAVYRGIAEDFVPALENLLASPADTMCLDDEWRWDERYYYKISALDVHGNESGYALLRPEDVTGDETPVAPAATYLAQNFPNPFNPSTRIEFGLAAPARVRLRIYDAAGRLVRELADESMPAGRYVKLWDGRNAGGSAVSSGIYFYRLDAGSFTETRKMVLLR